MLLILKLTTFEHNDDVLLNAMEFATLGVNVDVLFKFELCVSIGLGGDLASNSWCCGYPLI